MTQTVSRSKPPRRLSPDERLGHIPHKCRHTSAGLGWSGLRVEDFAEAKLDDADLVEPPLECVMLVLNGDTVAERAEYRCDGVRYVGDGSPHTMSLVPPGVECRWRWRNVTNATVYQLSPTLVAKVAEEAFDLDPERVHFPVRYFDPAPAVLNTLTTLRHELLAGGPGGRLCAESLANVLVVQLIRQVASRPATKDFARKLGGTLPRHAIRAVEEYIDAHLEHNIALADLAAVAHLSEFHFARQFKQTTGLPPHQFVIRQRVERAKRLIAAGRLSLAQVAAACGFSDQAHLTRQFKRVVGVTPGVARGRG